jgi:hypothetical protein
MRETQRPSPSRCVRLRRAVPLVPCLLALLVAPAWASEGSPAPEAAPPPAAAESPAPEPAPQTERAPVPAVPVTPRPSAPSAPAPAAESERLSAPRISTRRPLVTRRRAARRHRAARTAPKRGRVRGITPISAPTVTPAPRHREGLLLLAAAVALALLALSGFSLSRLLRRLQQLSHRELAS